MNQDTINILTLLRCKGIGKAFVYKNYKNGLKPKELMKLVNDYKRASNVTESSFVALLKNTEALLMYNKNKDVNFVNYLEDHFPKYNVKISAGQRPLVLFYKGDLSLLDTDVKGYIGLTKPSTDIVNRGKKLINNGTILSGLALGCDTVAHTMALELKLKTIAVLPSTLNKILPEENTGLSEDILLNGGLLLSEYYEETEFKLSQINRYIERDRLQALFSNEITLISSYSKKDNGKDSGARVAIEWAIKLGKKVNVMYKESDKDNAMFNLNRELIESKDKVNIIKV